MKDSLWSKTMPRNLVSSTTGTGVPLASWVGFTQFTEVYAYGFRGRELETTGVSPVCKFIKTLLEVTLDNLDMLRSVAHEKIVNI